VAPIPPSDEAPGAIPRLLHAAVTGLSQRHHVTVVTVAGPEPRELEMAERLPASGVDAHIVRRAAAPAPWQRWRRRFRLAWGWVGRRLPWRTVWFYEPEVQRLVERLTGEHEFDVIAVEDNAMAIYRYPPGIPAVLTEHEVRRARRWRLPDPRDGAVVRRALAEIDWQRWPGYQREAWGRFALVQAFTQRDADEIETAVPALRGRVRVRPFGIDMPAAADPANEVGDEILFVGNMTHHPNVDAALWLAEDVMPLIRAARPRAGLTIAGTSPPAQLRVLEREDVRVDGWVPDLRPLIERSRLMVAPIRVGGGMRMKVLEAMALGKAVVTTPRGAEGLDVDGHAPPVALADDAEGLARATLELLADAERRGRLGRAARAFVEEYHASAAYARRLEHVYREAVALADVAVRER